MEGIMKFFYHISVFGANAGFYIGGLLIHFWTIYITYEFMGGFWAFLSFCLPGISQLYWMFTFSMQLGFGNEYNMWIIALFIAKWGFTITTVLSARKLEKIEEAK